jgi:hypothetical protein
MRAFPGIAERQMSEDAFYGSDEWPKGPPDAVLADIVSSTTLVLRLGNATVQGLRTSRAPRP